MHDDVIEGTALVVRDEPQATLSLVESDFDPEVAVDRGIRQAKALQRIVQANPKMVANIRGKDFPCVEVWETLGQFNGLSARTAWTRKMEDGGYEARVELVNERTGLVVSAAESECSTDEEKWAKSFGHSLRSMAQTRATSKAFRMRLSWIVVLAGMEATPAEEMPRSDKPRREKPEDIEKARKRIFADFPQLKDDEYRMNTCMRLFNQRFSNLNLAQLRELYKEMQHA